MWPELRADIEAQLQILARSMRDTASYRAEMLSSSAEPSSWDRRAAAFAIQECYGGIEGVLKRIAVVVDGRVPAGSAWHIELMRQLAAGTDRRPAVLPPSLVPALQDCLGFRHVARTHYGFDLDWPRLRAVLERLPTVVSEFSSQIRSFLDTFEAGAERP